MHRSLLLIMSISHSLYSCSADPQDNKINPGATTKQGSDQKTNDSVQKPTVDSGTPSETKPYSMLWPTYRSNLENNEFAGAIDLAYGADPYVFPASPSPNGTWKEIAPGMQVTGVGKLRVNAFAEDGSAAVFLEGYPGIYGENRDAPTSLRWVDKRGNPISTFADKGVLPLKYHDGRWIRVFDAVVLSNHSIIALAYVREKDDQFSYPAQYLLIKISAEGKFDGGFGERGIRLLKKEFSLESKMRLFVDNDDQVQLLDADCSVIPNSHSRVDSHTGQLTGLRECKALSSEYGVESRVYDALFLPNGYSIALRCGGIAENDCNSKIIIERWTPDGVPDPEFGNGGWAAFDRTIFDQLAGSVKAEYLTLKTAGTANGDVLISGFFEWTSPAREVVRGMIRIKQQGDLDTSFGKAGVVGGIVLTGRDGSHYCADREGYGDRGLGVSRPIELNDGLIVVAGYGREEMCLFGYLPDGSKALSFGTQYGSQDDWQGVQRVNLLNYKASPYYYPVNFRGPDNPQLHALSDGRFFLGLSSDEAPSYDGRSAIWGFKY